MEERRSRARSNTNVINVLLIEDNKEDVAFIRSLIAEQKLPEFNLIQADRMGTALGRLLKKDIDVVLLDLTLPDCQGLHGFDRLKLAYPALPIVILSAVEDESIAMEAVHRGAQDYLVKYRFEPTKVFSIAIMYAIERQKIHEELRELSLKDELTGLYNRRGFVTLAEMQFKYAKRSKKGFLLFLFDLDNLKSINDKQGHTKGDEALKRMAEILHNTFRGSDIISRFGGDEFAVIASEAHPESSEIIADRLKAQIKLANRSSSSSYTISVSYGYAEYIPDQAVEIEQLVAQADKKMYEMKRAK